MKETEQTEQSPATAHAPVRAYQDQTPLERVIRSHLWQPADLIRRATARLPELVKNKEYRQAADLQEAASEAELVLSDWKYILDLYEAERPAMKQETPDTETGLLATCRALLADSSTFKHVLNFAFRMEGKLAANRNKGDRAVWLNNDPWYLAERLRGEAEEAQQCFTVEMDGCARFRDAEELANECADTANFCMMLADCATTREAADRT